MEKVKIEDLSTVDLKIFLDEAEKKMQFWGNTIQKTPDHISAESYFIKAGEIYSQLEAEMNERMSKLVWDA